MKITSDISNDLVALLARYDLDQRVVVADEAMADKTDFPTFVIRGGESAKTLETVQQIWDFLFEHDITRRGVIICLGGGVTTDLGGFAAATYKRGIDYINIPTTLLAMVDASTGGKTGFNYRGLKNAIGAFYEPVETLVYPHWLKALPPQEFLSGFAEMLKTGLLTKKHNLWSRLLQYDLEKMDIEELTPLIADCIAIKQDVIEVDPYEKMGWRKVLNFGHTFGHALEEVTGMRHGYAVLYGLIAELYLSVTLWGCPREPLQQLTQLMLQYYGRPECNCKDRKQLVQLMQQDKKNKHAGDINCTLLREVGNPVLDQTISEERAEEAWEYLFSL
ncbi:MAG: 3-dehydroquinate synthase [Paludibacteraceae bacterium]|nr:3-dehydroquinate synthase [Paludibacteraceae bacterium]